MSTPNEPQNPNGDEQQNPADPFRKPDPAAPQPPAYGAPQYGAAQPPEHGSPQYPAAPQYGAPQYPAAPQYGAPQYGAPGYGYPNPTEKNSIGVWALVLGILAIPCCGIFSGIPALVLGQRTKRYVAEGRANNGGMGTAAVVLGWVSVGITVIRVVLALSGAVPLNPFSDS